MKHPFIRKTSKIVSCSLIVCLFAVALAGILKLSVQSEIPGTEQTLSNLQPVVLAIETIVHQMR